MQDQILGRIWDAQHEQFSSDFGTALDAAANKARRLFGSVPMPLKAMAAVLAMSVTSLIFSAPVFAQEHIEVHAVSASVSYADLDIRNAAGRATLERRVRGTASQLCKPHVGTANGERVQRRRCYLEAAASARPQIDQAVARAQTRLASVGTITIAAR